MMDFDRTKDRNDDKYRCLGCEYCQRCKIAVEFNRPRGPQLGLIDHRDYRPLPMTIIIKFYDPKGYSYKEVDRDSFMYCRKGLEILRDHLQDAYSEILKDEYADDDYLEEVKRAYKNGMNFCNYHLAIHKKLNQ